MNTQARSKGVLAMLFVVNFTVNFEAALAEFLLPVVSEALGIPILESQAILYLYYVAIIGTLAISLTSKSPLMTRAPGFLMGGILFAAGTLLLVGMREGLVSVIAARLMQGAGVALIAAATPALIVHWRLAEHMKISPFTVIPVSIGLGMLAGPSLGAAVFTEARMFTLYVGISTTALAGIALMPLCRLDGSSEGRSHTTLLLNLDYGGLLAVALGLGSPWILSKALKGDVPLVFGLLFSLGLAVASWLLIERSDRTTDHPVVDIHFLTRETYLMRVLLMSALSFAGTYVIAYVLPFYIYYGTPFQGEQLKLGGTIVLVPLGFILGPMVFEALFKVNIKKSLWTSALAYLTALVGFGMVELTGVTLWLLLGGGALGVSRGIFVAPYNELTLDRVPVYRIDDTSAYNAIARYFGMVLGILVGSIIILVSNDLGSALLWALPFGAAFMVFSVVLIPSDCSNEV